MQKQWKRFIIPLGTAFFLLLPWEHFMACKQILLQFVARVGNISLFLWFKFVEKQFRR